MKFAKVLEDGRVAEWQGQYFDYKQGKKKIKAVTRAVRNATARQWRTPRQLPQRTPSQRGLTSSPPPSQRPDTAHAGADIDGDRPHLKRFGSIVGSPPSEQSTASPSRPASLNLGDPALDLVEPESHSGPASLGRSPPSDPVAQSRDANNAYEVGATKHPPPFRSTLRRALSSPLQSSGGHHLTETPLFRRMMSRNSSARFSKSPVDIPLEAQREVDARKAEFWLFLDKELKKIEDFYRMKEEEAVARMDQLKVQLHLLRDHRINDLELIKESQARKGSKAQVPKEDGSDDEVSSGDAAEDKSRRLKSLYSSMHAARHVHFHKSSASGPSMPQLTTPQADPLQNSHMDHERKPLPTNLSYHHAKRKLRAALQEYYRGLELLKSYVLLNRTAFRKINKKYDKAVRARPYMAFMSSVNSANFVQSDLLDSHLHQIEDLYTRYFEKGNRKVANAKLRRRGLRQDNYNRSSFVDGLAIAGGLVFGIQGLVYAIEHLYASPAGSKLLLDTSYLLQLYAGYLLMLLLMLYFCVICAIFDLARVNYVFIFEFDTRHHLNWRQLSELPCTLFFLLGLIMWLNFSRFGGDVMYVYYPVILIGLSFVVLGLPLPGLYHHSRFWLWKTFLRVAFLSGLVHVHFGDLILGDMFNSLTYSVGNVELFFCLYARDWNEPDQCNSSHSRLFGFFQTLPGIWRFFQCLRRFRDSGSPWPHLANAGKYMCSILSYMTLSIWRIDKADSNLAVFILFSCLNTFYTWVWDVMMDWSLFTLSSKHRGLRDAIAYPPATYHVAIVVDFILRSSWIFYVIFKDDSQHSSVVSFFIAFVEVFRRAMWTAFRVENDHCYNVVTNKAVRDLGLPYKVEAALDHTRTESVSEPVPARQVDIESGTASVTSGANYSPTNTRDSKAVQSLRRRQTGPNETPSPSIRNRVGQLMSSAHAQDFERSKPEDAVAEEEEDDEEDEDDLDEDERELEAYKVRTNE